MSQKHAGTKIVNSEVFWADSVVFKTLNRQDSLLAAYGVVRHQGVSIDTATLVWHLIRLFSSYSPV